MDEIYPPRLAGWGQQGAKIQTKNTKMIRMVFFVQKSEDFNFSLLVGSGKKSRLLVKLFNFHFFIPDILKEADINYFLMPFKFLTWNHKCHE